MPAISLTLTVLPNRFAVCRLDTHSPIPDWATAGEFFSITRTSDELSIVCPEENVPENEPCEGGWRLIKFAGPFDFSLTGILSAVAAPLAVAEVSIFALSTFDTDYILVKEFQLEKAVTVLGQNGHQFI